MDALKPFLSRVAEGANLSSVEATEAFEIILAGAATPAQIGAFLMALRVRGESVDEITAGAQVMRRHAMAVKAPDHALDTCGT
ncbi:MAG TPA: anthranilate phosphoribosyltransferase, partial [Rhodobiaceae bacterium]|nr:anthranilate phosphoribosyltransferase [Rhodobiaceae bacterium]